MAIKRTKAEDVATEEVKENEVVVQENEVAVLGDIDLDFGDLGFTPEELAELSGLEAMDWSDIRIPYARIAQKANKGEGIEQGDIILPDGTIIKGYDGETLKNISILAVQPIRAMFPQPFSPNNTFICRSLDGIVGADDGAYAGTRCSGCEFSKFPEKGGASPCSYQRLLICRAPDGSLFHFRVSGIGVKAFTTFMSNHTQLINKVRYLSYLKVQIGTKEEDTNFGVFAAPVFIIDKRDPVHSKEVLIESLEALKAYNSFKVDHLKSAATAERMERATGNEAEEVGENDASF